LLVCLVFDFIGQLGYALASEKWHFVAVSCLFGSMATMSFPAATGIVSNEVDSTEQGIMMASVSAVRELTSAMGPLLFGLISGLCNGYAWDYPPTPFFFAAFLLILAFVIGLRIPKDACM
jgi:MFS family permease